ncbi:MAG: geranylgeranyl pyrophosphate synthase [Halioglobus sp.]|jgi:farnesyl diphosphate synthase/geranylgeranyl diphosphate synthase type II
MKPDLDEYMSSKRAHVASTLELLISADEAAARVLAQSHLDELHSAARYSLASGGKRVRSILVYAAAESISSDESTSVALDHAACAMELMHSYSLIHDDLPAMDDDDLRRGKPSLHKAFDEATAILVGDGFQARAFELLAQAPGIAPQQKLNMIETLATTAGLHGMVGGQAIDIMAVDSTMNVQQLQTMHSLKTGALIRASLALGAITANANPVQLASLDRFGSHVGLAFQVVDDILDVEGSNESLGKTAGKDAQTNKPTYVKLLGLEGAKTEAARLLDASIEALDGFGESADTLRQIAEYIVKRKH